MSEDWVGGLDRSNKDTGFFEAQLLEKDEKTAPTTRVVKGKIRCHTWKYVSSQALRGQMAFP